MKKLRILAVVALTAVGALTATPAQAHYDPWTTHWHYSYYDGSPTYKMCSWWDSLWGCQSGYPR